jgi:hypothetical protein
LEGEKINSPGGTKRGDIALLMGTTKQAVGEPARFEPRATLPL